VKLGLKEALKREERRAIHTIHHPAMPARSSLRRLAARAHVTADGVRASSARRAFTSAVARPAAATSHDDTPNMRHASRPPQGRLHAPIVNPTGECQAAEMVEANAHAG